MTEPTAPRGAGSWAEGDTSVAVADPVAPTVPAQGGYPREASTDDLDPHGQFARPAPVDQPFTRAAPVDEPVYRSTSADQSARSYAAEPADEEDPPDEPAAQYVSPAEAARIARMTSEVLVVDGRPRYHLVGCVHLLGREGEPIPVGEAVELGFTPCSLCEPDSALLADARRV
ncbi:hypothetical protein [Polymorphospora rubra]|uniref:hypothetical protein n=1 Tax=Polymorphospora rubra TaxID=338584 RepID=UPI001FE4DAE7|nr:hypothetical protein [Polymorphospora rubra]